MKPNHAVLVVLAIGAGIAWFDVTLALIFLTAVSTFMVQRDMMR